MKKIRIAYCIPALYYPSGMERVITLKANYLARHGYEVHLILTDGGDKPPYYPLDASIKVHQLYIDFEELYRYALPRRVWLYRIRMRMLKNKLDGCLCTLRPDITVSLLRRDINVINQMTDGSIKMGEIHFDRIHYRNFSVSWLPSWLNACIERYWMKSLIREVRKLSKFVVLTHEDAAFWPELQNVCVIPNPVSFMPASVSDCSRKQVIAMGRYVAQKGFDHLIAAWRMVVDKHPDWVLKIYGDGHLRGQLQQQVEELNLADSCFLEHSVSDVESVFCKSSLFVLSSRFEGFGLVIVEAMACGLPVVSFACPCGPKDIIADGVDGILVEPQNVEELACKISYLIENEEIRKSMGHQAAINAHRYDIESIAPFWMQLFEEVLALKK